jgi:lipooligosaccharide transport system ATP-binding protein
MLDDPSPLPSARERGERATASRGDVVLQVDGLRKRYGDNEVVRGLSFTIHRGDCFGLLGPNGAGKTTTLRCCLGLIDPDGGSITMVGQPVPKHGREARIRVGVVPQMDNLDPDFTVRENLLIYGGYFGLTRDGLEGRLPARHDDAG